MVQTWHPKHIRLDQKGLAKIFGTLEAQVMDIVWEKGCITVRQACNVLCKKRDFSFNTIMTIMNRLSDKGVLKKQVKDGVYCYEARLPKEKFIETVSIDVLSDLLKDSKIFSLAAFADVIEDLPEKQLDAFTRLLKKKIGSKK